MTTSAPIVALEILSASVWTGSLVCLAVVSRAARTVLKGPAQVAFFRAVGRRYAIVGTGSLLVAIGTGLAMAWPPPTWSATIDAAVALAGLLVIAPPASGNWREESRRRASSVPAPRCHPRDDRGASRPARAPGLLSGAANGGLLPGADFTPVHDRARQVRPAHGRLRQGRPQADRGMTEP